jgi:ribokinase
VRSSRPTVAVVGHVEWVQFARVDHVPKAGEIAHAGPQFEEPAGGGAVVAVALARLGADSTLLTALGEDEQAAQSVQRLRELGVRVRAVTRALPTRRAVTLIDPTGERTITTIGPRLEPAAEDRELGFDELEGIDAVYFTAGDAAALHAARAARVLVASPRARSALDADVTLDALILSAEDASESGVAEAADAELVIETAGAHGGSWRTRTGEEGSWAAVLPPGPIVDAYGCGDAFAAGVTYGLGAQMGIEGAVALGARCAAVTIAGQGPYGHALSPELIDYPPEPPDDE